MPGRPLCAAAGRRASPRLAVVLLAVLLSVLLSGCSDEPEQAREAAPEAAPVGAAATTTRAAELRAALTYLLTERVHLVLVHARELQRSGGDAGQPAVAAARQAFSSSGDEVVDVLGGSYSDARDELAPAARTHDRELLAHTVALVAGDEQAAAAAVVDLEGAGGELARAVRQVVPGLRAQDVEAAVRAGTSTTLEAVGAVVARSPRAAALQRAADEAAWGTARLLAVGVSTDRGLGLAGSPASELRSRLTGLLAEHVLLSAELAQRLAAAPGDVDDPHVRATEAALDAAAVSLADLMGRTAPETALPVLAAWRDHLREVRELAAARIAGAPPPAAPLDYLERLRAALAPYADPLPPRAAELGATAAASLREAVDAAATGRESAPELLRGATQDTVAPAALLAAALAEQLRLR